MNEKFYCWLNAVPNAVKFYLRIGFTYIGHSSEGKGYMLYDMDESPEQVQRKLVIQRKNSTNLTNIIKMGNPNTKTVELRNITQMNFDDIPDINRLIDALSKNRNNAQTLFMHKRVPVDNGGYYLPNGSFDEIYNKQPSIPPKNKRTTRQPRYFPLPSLSSLQALIGRPPKNRTLRPTSYRNQSRRRSYVAYP
jgi:hypothetical protein